MGTDIEGLGHKLLAVQSIATINSAAQLLLALVIITAVVMVWMGLMVRKLLIIVSAVFTPIAFSGATADITKGWVRKWIELVTALATAKLILVIILMVGVTVLNGAGSTGQGGGHAVTHTVIGALILLMGGLTPWLAVKMVHFAGDSFHVMHANAGAATAGAAKLVAAPQKLSSAIARAQQMTSQVSRLSGSSGGSTPPPDSDQTELAPESPPDGTPETSSPAVEEAGMGTAAGPVGDAVATGTSMGESHRRPPPHLTTRGRTCPPRFASRRPRRIPHHVSGPRHSRATHQRSVHHDVRRRTTAPPGPVWTTAVPRAAPRALRDPGRGHHVRTCLPHRPVVYCWRHRCGHRHARVGHGVYRRVRPLARPSRC
jgi:hypothetical protein